MNTKLQLIILIALSLFISACATNYAKAPPSETASAVKIQDSEFDSNITFIGPNYKTVHQRGIFSDYHHVRLRSFKNKKTKQITHELYVDISYIGSWRFYQKAQFKGGSSVNLNVIARNVEFCGGAGCSYNETLALNLSSQYLQNKSNSGFQIRFDSKSGHKNIIYIPANYIQGYLLAVK